MANALQAIRGMNDILPEQSFVWQFAEDTIRAVVEAYGFREIRMPVVEKTELFKRSIGEVTDIVEKEMYTFDDRNGDSLTLRPEGTAGCARACIQHGLTNKQAQRLWYTGPMFRHERPQKGRYRQFYQVGVEVFGLEGPDVDAELLMLTARLWRRLGLDRLSLQVNSLGTSEARERYRTELVAYLKTVYEQLDADSQRRLETNPLRILDSKNMQVQALLEQAPRLADYIDEKSQAHFETLCALLDDAGVDYDINPHLVRGLDYYSRTVFEWVTDRLGAQGTVCAGGRFDGLVEQLGGRSTPAVGFAMGLERLVAVLEEIHPDATETSADLYLVLMGEAASRAGLVLSEQIRAALPQVEVITHCGGGGMKAQFKGADRSGARYALVLGDEELETGTVMLKPLRTGEQQSAIARDELIETLTARLAC